MLTADELRSHCLDLRNRRQTTDDAMVAMIVADVEEYRKILAASPTQLPPDQLAELLPLMGWLMYETTWDCVQRITTSFNRKAATEEGRRAIDREREVSEIEADRIRAIVDAARAIPWPEFAPRALGALRAAALAASKTDTVVGYDAAWLLHEEGRQRYDLYLQSHGTAEDRERFVRDLDEVFLQLALAETGTACRTAERVISRWAEEFRDDANTAGTARDAVHWMERMFRELTAGVAVGQRAISTARMISEKYGFVDTVTEERMALKTALQNPGIMTARAALLLVALAPAMESYGRSSRPYPTWQAWEDNMLAAFKDAYDAIEHPAPGTDVLPPMKEDFRRQLVHMRLNLALLKPGSQLPSSLSFDPCLQISTLDDDALDALSDYLAGPDGTKGRERSIGAATMPAFIRSVITGRRRGRDDHGYQAWRLKWFRLDQFANEPDRRKNVENALREAG